MMKKLLFFALCALSLTACADDNKVITFNALPQPAQCLMLQYVHAEDVLLVVQDGYSPWADYEVKMNDLSVWEFDAKGTLESVEMPTGIPDGLIPPVILKQVRAAYANAVVIEYSIDRRDQEIKLTNGIELKFDLSGRLIEMDID